LSYAQFFIGIALAQIRSRVYDNNMKDYFHKEDIGVAVGFLASIAFGWFLMAVLY